ncbi:hypothetical protein WOSG25_012940 [Weissella oryzae SG25]|uniref:HTH cro/C1-type domain-containing protein n=1 Tax=Weissella oryzae (strain DSM 25784 / JCM 18191 / LMG 30913 / SG25) TaxID=1329250 RepID=A0A069CS35_WEIOS|nr:transcriptional regulator [Weissella oryzae]GAK30197.1 hypothetical protein WOSG25_012940 [Weissella oryzae SG25]
MDITNKIPATALRTAIIYFIKERHVSIPNILKNVNVSRSRLYDYLQGNGKISATTMANILLVIGISFDEIITHIYITQPELVPTIIKDLHLSSNTKQPKKPVLSDVNNLLDQFKFSNDVSLLTELVISINYRVTDPDEHARLMQPILPVITKLFRKRRFFSNIDTLLYANVLFYQDYEEAKEIVAESYNYANSLSQLEDYGLNTVRSNLISAYHNYGLIALNLLMLAIHNDDTAEIKRIIAQIANFELIIPDFYFGVVRRSVEIIQLILDNDFVAAEATWHNLKESIAFVIDAKLTAPYYYLTKKNYVDFEKPITDYLDRI